MFQFTLKNIHFYEISLHVIFIIKKPTLIFIWPNQRRFDKRVASWESDQV